MQDFPNICAIDQTVDHSSIGDRFLSPINVVIMYPVKPLTIGARSPRVFSLYRKLFVMSSQSKLSEIPPISEFFKIYDKYVGEFIGEANCPLAWVYRETVAVDQVVSAVEAGSALL